MARRKPTRQTPRQRQSSAAVQTAPICLLQQLKKADIGDTVNVLDLLCKGGTYPLKAEGRRLVQQGGLSIDGEKVTDPAFNITADMLGGDGIVIKKGKKVFHRIFNDTNEENAMSRTDELFIDMCKDI